MWRLSGLSEWALNAITCVLPGGRQREDRQKRSRVRMEGGVTGVQPHKKEDPQPPEVGRSRNGFSPGDPRGGPTG